MRELLRFILCYILSHEFFFSHIKSAIFLHPVYQVFSVPAFLSLWPNPCVQFPIFSLSVFVCFLLSSISFILFPSLLFINLYSSIVQLHNSAQRLAPASTCLAHLPKPHCCCLCVLEKHIRLFFHFPDHH